MNNWKRGSEAPCAKLTDEAVKEARELYENARESIANISRKVYIENYSVGALAKKYGVHRVTMQRALLGETWSHIP